MLLGSGGLEKQGETAGAPPGGPSSGVSPEKLCGEIALPGVRQDDDDGLSGILRPCGQERGRAGGRTGGDAHQQPLGPHQGPSGLQRLHAGDG